MATSGCFRGIGVGIHGDKWVFPIRRSIRKGRLNKNSGVCIGMGFGYNGGLEWSAVNKEERVAERTGPYRMSAIHE